MAFTQVPKKTITYAPTISAGAYSAKDQVGEIQELEVGGEHVTLDSVTVIDGTDQAAELAIHLFSSLPVVTNADNEALAMSDANALKYVGSVIVGNTAYDMDATTSQTAYEKDVGIDCDVASGSVYAIVTAIGTPTYGATSGLTFKYSFSYNHAG